MTLDRKTFEAQAAAGAGDARALAAGVRAGHTESLSPLAALWVHAAAAAPERIAAIYDASALGCLGRPVDAAPIRCADARPEPIPDAFWTAFWALLDEPPGELGPGGVTSRTAALGALLSPGLAARNARAALAFPGCAEAAAQGWPARFTLAELARCPRRSLGGEFHALIVDNGFDLEVLDRDALGLADLPPPQGYLNARILQCHDLWHLVAGYRTTGLHEVAISGFQLGQFGHGYSALFLGMALTQALARGPEDAALPLDVILAGWTHGRESPPLLGVDWPAVWDQPVETVRERLGILPFASAWPADLFEQPAAA